MSMTIPTPEDFQIWREHPITQWVLEAAQRIADGQKDNWAAYSWSDAPPDHAYLIRKRAMAAAYADLANITREACLKAHGVEEQGS